MNIFQKIILSIWFLFNRDKYIEYIKTFEKIYIYNKFFYCDDVRAWYINVITSEGDLLHSANIFPNKLDETVHFFSQDVKILYNDTFSERDYEIVNLFPDTPEPVEYRKAADIILEKREKERQKNVSPSNESWIFPED